jgi:hypothetical protein
MTSRQVRAIFARSIAVCALLLLSLSALRAEAGTILKLTLGDTGPDLEYSGGIAGVFSTVDENDPNTAGEQNTAVDFVGDLGFIPDILTADASYTLDGVAAAGLGAAVNGQVGQLFGGGNFKLWDDNNGLLLDVNLTSSALSGFIGSTAGAVFSINNGVAVAGTLLPYLDPGSVSFSIALGGINDPGGMSITPVGPPTIIPGFIIQPATVNAFTADGDKLIAADVIIPEPTSILLVLVGGFAFQAGIRRRAS